MIVVDEYAALLGLVDRAPADLGRKPLVITYSRAYRLTRALLDPGPGRLQVRGRFTRLVDALTPDEQRSLHDRLAAPDPAVLSVLYPRPTIRTAGAMSDLMLTAAAATSIAV